MNHRCARPVLLPLVCLTTCLTVAAARAGTISISITPDILYQDGKVTADVQAANSGDEPAHTVTAVLRLGDKEVRGPVNPSLPPSGTMHSELTLETAKLAPGQYPFQIAVDYTDANQYPFQALHVGLLNIGSTSPAKVTVRDVQAAPFASHGYARGVVKNLSGTAREAAVRAIAPEGIEVTEPVQTVQLPAWGEANVSLPLINRTALAASRLPVFVVVEYDEEGVHHGIVGQGMVGILPPQSFFKEHQSVLIGGAIALVLGWGGVALWLTLGRSRRAESRA